MPVFVYAAPVTATGALLLTLGALAFERASPFAAGAHGALGYLRSGHYAPYVVYLAIGPGCVGHTGINAILRFHAPLVISMALTLEPLIGSVMAWAAGVAGVPGPLTWLGGAVLLGSLLYLSYCESRRTAAAEAKAVAAAATKAAFEGGESGTGDLSELGAFQIADVIDDEVELLEHRRSP